MRTHINLVELTRSLTEADREAHATDPDRECLSSTTEDAERRRILLGAVYAAYAVLEEARTRYGAAEWASDGAADDVVSELGSMISRCMPRRKS